MRRLPARIKLSFTLCASVLLALVSPSLAAAATRITLQPASGPAGSKVTVTGYEFQKKYTGWVKFRDVRVATVSTGATGKFSATFTVSAAAQLGSGTVLASVGSRQASATFNVTAATSTSPTTNTGLLFADDFTGFDGVITSASQYFTTNDHPLYGLDTGTLQRVSNMAHPDPSSDPRIFTQKMDFAGVRIDVRVRVNSYTYNTSDYTGVKVWTRRVPNTSVDPKHPVSANNSPAIYVCQPMMSNGKAFIQKKQQGNDSYSILAQRASGSFPVVLGQWYSIRCELSYEGSAVRHRMYRNGVLISDVLDNGAVGGPAILGKGAIGVRGDGVNFDFDDLTVTAL